jgi:glycosyltransferase involved in cell wall biosynthesis
MYDMRSTLICSTYNNPKFLEMVLDSLFYQSSKSFELIIADDGSGDETKQVIKKLKQKATFPVIHIWHKDSGWRKSQIHNIAISKANTEHLIFIDGDCILSDNFIFDHQKIFYEEKSKYILMGRRVELGQRFTNAITLQNYKKLIFSPLPVKLLTSCLLKDSRSFMRKFSFYHPLIRRIFRADNVYDLLGSNFSLPKSTMFRINGFNNEYKRGEDGDIFIRVRNLGHKLIGKKYFSPMFHLYHNRGNYQYVDDNYKEILKNKKYTRCKDGLVFDKNI